MRVESDTMEERLQPNVPSFIVASGDEYPSRAFRDAMPLHCVMALLITLGMGYIGRLDCAGRTGNPFFVTSIMCVAVSMLRLGLHTMADFKRARKIGLITWTVLATLQSMCGIYYGLHQPTYNACGGAALFQHLLPCVKAAPNPLP